jgi:transposase
MCGVDLTRIDGIDVTTALAVVSETGADMSRFPSDGHFVSWLGLCPGTKITGGKVMSGKTKRCANRSVQALRLAAAALRTSQSALGAYFRRMCSRMDKPKAITAAAHKLSRGWDSYDDFAKRKGDIQFAAPWEDQERLVMLTVS